MHFEPAFISHDDLRRLLARDFSIEATGIQFIPVGAACACYRVDSHGGGRFFLKAWAGTPGSDETSARQETVLPLLRLMRENELPVTVPVPLLGNDGAPFAFLPGSDTRVAVFPFFDGDSPEEDAGVPPELIEPLAEAIAAYHSAPPWPKGSLPELDALDVYFEAELQDALLRLAMVHDDARPGLVVARNVILPRLAEFDAFLLRANELRDSVHRLQGSRVLCHTDLGGSNLLVTPEGELVILDWDWAIVAPPEHDLQTAATSEHFAHFLRVYREAGGAEDLHLDHFAFYLVRRYLADMTHRLLLLLDYNETAEQDEEALYGIHAYGFDRFDALGGVLANIAAALGSL